MDYLGIGVLIIAIAFAIIAIFLVRTLNNLADVLKGVDRTVDELPSQLDNVMNETTDILKNSNVALADVNEKLRALSPLFYIVGDVGESSRQLSSSLVDVTHALKKNTTEGEDKVGEQGWNGLYGALALSYYLVQKRKALKENLPEKNHATE
ncbi:DUF948 domain-containing protein [Salimicrobium flavidum]|uniref:Uncharacterized protein YoxC, contains an MCP-like domain n=1 Tax=Salimicrobium flavidum TaxID=570947 RepID=A0A1N7IST0_9BACI|nr:DUF948 domain-containing protein [Salimicrobium flavidum]SIS40143.1 Uncharacterized protein YoxC, contains an MCP-like domain [Salimicrobium flavidum]